MLRDKMANTLEQNFISFGTKRV